MDIAVVINGIVDTVWRGFVIDQVPEYPGAIFIECEADTVFGGFAFVDGAFIPPPVIDYGDGPR